MTREIGAPTLITSAKRHEGYLAPLFGSESVVSEVLGGRREINKRQIEKLSQRFNVSPAVFF
jgi:antitoxin component HigA of HigAB toxin-antitoxin module